MKTLQGSSSRIVGRQVGRVLDEQDVVDVSGGTSSPPPYPWEGTSVRYTYISSGGNGAGEYDVYDTDTEF